MTPSYGERLREQRGRIARSTLARELGVANETVARWESDQNSPSLANARRLRDFYEKQQRKAPETVAWIVDERPASREPPVPEPASPKRRWRVVAVVLAGIVLIAAAALVVVRHGSGSPTPRPSGPTIVVSRPGDPGDQPPPELAGKPDCRTARDQLEHGPPHFAAQDDGAYGTAIGWDEQLVSKLTGRLRASDTDYPGRLEPYVKARKSIDGVIGWYAPVEDIPVAFRPMHDLYYNAILQYERAIDEVIRTGREGLPGDFPLEGLQSAQNGLARASAALDFCTGGRYVAASFQGGDRKRFPNGILHYGPKYPIGSEANRREPFAGQGYTGFPDD